jgi:hypothetical protein
VRQKKAFNCAVEHDDPQPLIRLDSRDDFIQPRQILGAENVQWWKIKRYTPVRWRTLFDANLLGIRDIPHVCLQEGDPAHRNVRGETRDEDGIRAANNM